jgi:predicted nuclease of predicted toxin-antitoxin system
MRLKGFNVVTLTEVNLHGAEDEEIAAYAAKNNLAVLTQDHHFIGLYRAQYRRKLTVIFVKTKDADSQAIIKTIINLHAKLDLHKIQNQLVLTSEKKVRAAF